MKVHFFRRPRAKEPQAAIKRPRSVIGRDKKEQRIPIRCTERKRELEKRDFLAPDFQGDFLWRPTSLNAFLLCRMFQIYCWIKRRCFVRNILGFIRLYSSCFCVPSPPPFFPWHSLRLLFKRGEGGGPRKERKEKKRSQFAPSFLPFSWLPFICEMGVFPGFYATAGCNNSNGCRRHSPHLRGRRGCLLQANIFAQKRKENGSKAEKKRKRSGIAQYFPALSFSLGNPERNNPNPTICRIGLWPPAHLHHHRWCPKSKSPRRLTTEHFLNNPPSTSAGEDLRPKIDQDITNMLWFPNIFAVFV